MWKGEDDSHSTCSSAGEPAGLLECCRHYCYAAELGKTRHGSQTSIRCLTSGEQACDQEAAVQQTFHFERSCSRAIKAWDLNFT